MANSSVQNNGPIRTPWQNGVPTEVKQQQSIQNSTDAHVVNIKPNEVISQSGQKIANKQPVVSLKNKITMGEKISNKLANMGEGVKNIFSQIFSAIKAKIQKKDINSISRTVTNNEKQIENSKMNLVGVEISCTMTPLSFADEKSKILMPYQFARDLRQEHLLIINGKELRSSSLETIEAKVEEMRKVLGEDGSIGAARLLHQGATSDAFFELNALANKDNWRNVPGETMQYEIKVQGDNVTLVTRQFLSSISDKEANLHKKEKFVGLESKVTISLKELKRVGGFSSEQLKEIKTSEESRFKELEKLKDQERDEIRRLEKEALKEPGKPLDLEKFQKLKEITKSKNEIEKNLHPDVDRVKIERCSYTITNIYTNIEKAKNKLTPPLEPFTVNEGLKEALPFI